LRFVVNEPAIKSWAAPFTETCPKTKSSFIVIANALFGLIAGYLYWNKGLESARIARMLVHIVMFTASYFGAYF
jgi:hypothetical protein